MSTSCGVLTSPTLLGILIMRNRLSRRWLRPRYGAQFSAQRPAIEFAFHNGILIFNYSNAIFGSPANTARKAFANCGRKKVRPSHSSMEANQR